VSEVFEQGKLLFNEIQNALLNFMIDRMYAAADETGGDGRT
jgi:hypothetical protein